jgi:D-alanine--poly(phosphoribitol) ligase subunit 2
LHLTIRRSRAQQSRDESALHFERAIMNEIDIESIVGKFISDTFLFHFDDSVTPASDLFDAALIDSFGFVQLIAFIEDFFNIKISEDELASDDIRCLNGIVMIVRRAQAQANLAIPAQAKQTST